MNTIAEITEAVRTLSVDEKRMLHELIEEMMEDEMELSAEFAAKLGRADAQLAAGEGRVKQPAE